MRNLHALNVRLDIHSTSKHSMVYPSYKELFFIIRRDIPVILNF